MTRPKPEPFRWADEDGIVHDMGYDSSYQEFVVRCMNLAPFGSRQSAVRGPQVTCILCIQHELEHG